MTPAAIQTVRVTDTLPDGFESLRQEAAGEGYAFLDRLAQEIERGDYAVDADLPVLFAVFAEGDLAGLGGLTPDPYDPAPDIARLRHVYVRASSRRLGIGRAIASALVQQGFVIAARLSLRAADDRAAAFWEAEGFARDLSGAQRTHLLER